MANSPRSELKFKFLDQEFNGYSERFDFAEADQKHWIL